MKARETYWLIGTLTTTLAIGLLLYSYNGFGTSSTHTIPLHRSYVVLGNSQSALALGVLLFFVLYLLRAVRKRFINTTINSVLMLSIIGVLLLLQWVVVADTVSASVPEGLTIYPPLENETDMEQRFRETVATDQQATIPYPLPILLIQLLLLLLFAYCGFATGRNYPSAP